MTPMMVFTASSLVVSVSAIVVCIYGKGGAVVKGRKLLLPHDPLGNYRLGNKLKSALRAKYAVTHCIFGEEEG